MAAALLLAGCTSLAPPYEAPAMPVSQRYAESAEVDNAQASDMAWRDYFTDPALQAVIAEALAHNRDLRLATLRVAEARAAYGIQRADALPSVGASAGMARIGLPGNLGAGLPPSLAAMVPGTLTSYSAFAGISSWELDLWGRVRNLSDAALRQYFAAEWAQRGATVSLIAQTANAWLALRETDERLALARQALDNRAESLRIFSRRVDVGATSQLDLTQVRTLHQQAQALVAQLEQQRATQQHALDLIVGAPTPVAVSASQPGADALRPLPAGLPSELLTRRPDIQAAEQLLLAAHAQIGVARAAFLPSISLTAMAGSASGELGDLFGSGTGAWLFRPSLSLPIFTAGKLKNNLNLAEVRRDAAVAQYEKAIQGAFRDVSDALAAQQGLARQVQVLGDMHATQAERARLSRLRYDNGAARFFEVLDAERDLLATAQQLAQTRRALLASRVALYAALGGGADTTPVSRNPTATP
ncbi:NodT family RND efflux system outer membrane lipoprotein [Alicycliphilus sp. B1]|nr:NodT family RND efflux system outer membrane lipoprotein [Alicycliphilus sp. B1]